MGFWDDPASWPSDGSWPGNPGGSIEGTVTKLAVLMGRYGRLSLCVELDNDGRQRWANSRLWRTMGDARIETGDRVRITRGPDEPNPGGKPSSTWTVERLAPTPSSVATAWPAQAQAPAAAAGPTW